MMKVLPRVPFVRKLRPFACQELIDCSSRTLEDSLIVVIDDDASAGHQVIPGELQNRLVGSLGWGGKSYAELGAYLLSRRLQLSDTLCILGTQRSRDVNVRASRCDDPCLVESPPFPR